VAFTVPQFPLTCDIYDGPWLSKVFRLSSSCNLGQGRRVQPVEIFENAVPAQYNVTPQLLLPALTDVRDFSAAPQPDVVEVPSGSNRWYAIWAVDDIGKGFPNEHRFAMLYKIFEGKNPIDFAGCIWPTPIT